MSLLDAQFGAYVAVAALLIVTPGPDTALVTRNALFAGRRPASFTTLGIGVGSAIWALASVLGIAVLLEESAVALTICKLAGSTYLAYLGMRSIIASLRENKRSAATARTSPAKPLNVRTSFRQGLFGNLLNPKAGLIFATIFPQFISPGDSPSRLLLMLLAYEAILLSWLNIYGYLISRAGQSRFGARVRNILQGVTGVVLLALGARLVFERQ